MCRAYAKENRLSDMERLVERMKITGCAAIGATFEETLESFGLSSGGEDKSALSAVDDSADDAGGDDVEELSLDENDK